MCGKRQLRLVLKLFWHRVKWARLKSKMDKKIIVGAGFIAGSFTMLAALFHDSSRGPSETILATCGNSSVVMQDRLILPDSTVFNIEGSSGLMSYPIDNRNPEVVADMTKRFGSNCARQGQPITLAKN